MSIKSKKLYPLKFAPILKERVWGGEKLVKQYNKVVPTDEESGDPLVKSECVGESWEISDIGDENTEIINGFLSENTLSDVMETYMGELVGENIFDYYGLQFPLLVKLLNIKDFLSIQVHPDDETAFERYYSYGKNEFWYVMEADRDASIYMGFNRRVSASEFYEKCKNGTVEEVMNVYHPKKGDCFFIEAGTVHSAGGGLVLAEIQESSDLTFRLYDWGRERNPSTARKMHLEEAIDIINYEKYDENRFYSKEVHGFKEIADCRHFTINNIELKDTYHIYTERFNSCIIYLCVSGSASLQVTNSDSTDVYEINTGETILIPADMDDFFIVPKESNTNLLEVYIRKIEEDEDTYINEDVPDHLDDNCDCGHHHNHSH
ncbi:MAG: class I mannose-6-phosphate isomerase [Bacteroidales bacterium]|nr:class I mannose-6-phosphate isomerase [Bacteroidales bacterium]MDD4670519.1 class I mannose-6-phosphate isomerase [Bacteroidales bacterium]